MKRIINRFFLLGEWSNFPISSWCLLFFPMIQQKIEFQDVLLNKLKVVHESANAMTKTLLLKSCSWYFQNCSGYFCCCCCMSLLKTENENSLKSNVTLLRDAAAYLQVPWPFSILSLWKNKEELYNTSIATLFQDRKIKTIPHSNLPCKEPAPREMTGEQHVPGTINSWKRKIGPREIWDQTRSERYTHFQLLVCPDLCNHSPTPFWSWPISPRGDFFGLLFTAAACYSSCYGKRAFQCGPLLHPPLKQGQRGVVPSTAGKNESHVEGMLDVDTASQGTVFMCQ